jgi:hypothetical protein
MESEVSSLCPQEATTCLSSEPNESIRRHTLFTFVCGLFYDTDISVMCHDE